ncbi:cAMP-specific 3',5'-cyclic phosphodiesterase-like [Venturia canescens]|uniref:cAMP-specific 3',5'-cyclic phosphodiesterase-like n=1 Tax=Venturia canescens TaxID=32260 RepID=UPI001C9C0703|nr:cAMP-specific 3',5'-cyclic phosphodiesterase-like [Venturia canescens]
MSRSWSEGTSGSSEENFLASLNEPFVRPRSSWSDARRQSLAAPYGVSIRRKTWANASHESRDEQKLDDLYMYPDIDIWGVNLFQLSNRSNQPLTSVAYSAFQRHDLFRALEIPAKTFLIYMMNIENRYIKTNPFHNSLHAADVTQTAHTLLIMPSFQSVFEPLEIAATLFAAAIHDVNHPALTNQFLINTSSELALTYNDISVLENHHLAVAFKLLQKKDNDIFVKFKKEQRKKLRKLVIDMVLSTDMSKHNSLVASFKELVARKEVNNAGVLRLRDDSDKFQVLDCLVHCADLSNPTKPLDIYKQWTTRIMDEFWAQGDKERELGMEISPMCDRNTADVAKIQVGFIDFVVAPLWNVWAQLVDPNAEHIVESLQNNREYYRDLMSQSSRGPGLISE